MMENCIFVTVFHIQKEAGFVWGDVLNAETQNKNRKQFAEETKTIYEFNYYANFQEVEKDKMKYSWHVKWRRYCPISWLLCWMFEKGWLRTEFLLSLECFFRPEEREFQEEFSRKEIKEELDRIKKKNLSL